MNGVLQEIAHLIEIEATEQLRLLLEAGIHELKVDVISCFLDAAYIPFAKAIIGSVPLGRQNRLRFWPFYFPGTHDPVPLFAMLNPQPPERIIRLPDGLHKPEEMYRGEPARSEYALWFSDRERIEWVYKLAIKDAGRDIALLFFSQRYAPTARVDPDGPRREFRGVQEDIPQFGELVRAVLARVNIPKDTESHYVSVTREFLARAEQLARALPVGDDPLPNSERLVDYFHWLLDAAASIIKEPTVVGSCYCITAGSGAGKRLLKSRPMHDLTEHLSLAPVADSGLVDPKRKLAIRRLFHYKDMKLCLDQGRRARRLPTRANSRSLWSGRRLMGLVPPYRRCGMVTVATYMSSPLYIADVQRRFCLAAPWYGLAYAVPHTKCRQAYCIPLLKIFKAGSPGEEPRAIGAISLESSHRFVISPKNASYLACLFHLAVQFLDEKLFDRASIDFSENP